MYHGPIDCTDLSQFISRKDHLLARVPSIATDMFGVSDNDLHCFFGPDRSTLPMILRFDCVNQYAIEPFGGSGSVAGSPPRRSSKKSWLGLVLFYRFVCIYIISMRYRAGQLRESAFNSRSDQLTVKMMTASLLPSDTMLMDDQLQLKLLLVFSLICGQSINTNSLASAWWSLQATR